MNGKVLLNYNYILTVKEAKRSTVQISDLIDETMKPKILVTCPRLQKF